MNPKGVKAQDGVEVWTYEAAEQTQVLASAMTASGSAGAVLTRRPLGKGAVYAVGHDLATFASPRCYLNCFEPSGDVMRLLFEGALREGSEGHIVILHTVPSSAPSVLALTHDVTSHEAENSGDWGEAGALQFARVEKERGVRATYFTMTDYRGRHFNKSMVRELCNLGMCPLGVSGVAHVPRFAQIGDGMVKVSERAWRCKETLATYSTASLCGEVMLSRQLVQSAGSGPPRAWRSPSMAYHAQLIDVLAGNAIFFDSSFGVGDLPYNLPVDMATTGIQERRFHRRALLEFPLSADDGIDTVTDTPQGRIRERLELGPETEARFRGVWQYIMMQNTRNRAHTILRVSPSRGEKMPPANVSAKATMLGRFLDYAKTTGALIRSLDELGTFWRARLDAKLEARFDKTSGYGGVLTIGKTTAAGLTLEFGDLIKSFDCAKCGQVTVSGRRVTIESALAPQTRAEFLATVR